MVTLYISICCIIQVYFFDFKYTRKYCSHSLHFGLHNEIFEANKLSLVKICRHYADQYFINVFLLLSLKNRPMFIFIVI